MLQEWIDDNECKQAHRFAEDAEASTELSIAHLLNFQTRLVSEVLRLQELVLTLQAKNRRRGRRRGGRARRQKDQEVKADSDNGHVGDKRRLEGRLIPAKIKRARLDRMDWVLFGANKYEKAPAVTPSRVEARFVLELEEKLYGWKHLSVDRVGESRLVCQQVDRDQVRDVLSALHASASEQHDLQHSNAEEMTESSDWEDDYDEEEYERECQLRQVYWQERLRKLRGDRVEDTVERYDDYERLDDVTVVLIEEACHVLNAELEVPYVHEVRDMIDTAAVMVASTTGTVHAAWNLAIDVRKQLYGAGSVRKDELVLFRDKVMRKMMSYDVVSADARRVMKGLRTRPKRARKRRAVGPNAVHEVMAALVCNSRSSTYSKVIRC